MKTPEEILQECTGHGYGLTTLMHIKAMKIYANQKIEQAGDIAYKAVDDDKSPASVEYLIYEIKDFI